KRRLIAKSIADAAYRMNERLHARRIHLSAQIAHMDVQFMVPFGEIRTPRLVQQLSAAHGLSGVADQGVQKAKFLRSEGELLPCSDDLVAIAIQNKIPDFEHGRFDGFFTAEHCT